MPPAVAGWGNRGGSGLPSAAGRVLVVYGLAVTAAAVAAGLGWWTALGFVAATTSLTGGVALLGFAKRCDARSRAVVASRSSGRAGRRSSRRIADERPSQPAHRGRGLPRTGQLQAPRTWGPLSRHPFEGRSHGVAETGSPVAIVNDCRPRPFRRAGHQASTLLAGHEDRLARHDVDGRAADVGGRCSARPEQLSLVIVPSIRRTPGLD